MIGIGCGATTDGQILVLQDVIGMTPKPPRFAHNFLQEAASIAEAVYRYSQAVQTGDFPNSAPTGDETRRCNS